MKWSSLVVVCGLIFFQGCFFSKAQFSAGDCLMAADGYVLRVSKVDGSNYVVQGWLNHAWGEESAVDMKTLSAQALVKIDCSKVSAK